MRRSTHSLLVIASALGATLAAPGLAAEEQVVEQKRVVVRVNVDPVEQSYNYVFVDHEDGEPILLDSVFANRGYLGVALLNLTPELREHFGVAADAGVMISKVEPESPAFRAGLQTGDILTRIDGDRVGSAREVVQHVSEGQSEQTLELEVLRAGEVLSIPATLATRKRQQLDLGGLIMRSHPQGHGHGEPIVESVPLVELDPDSMGRALSLMRQHFDSPEWREQIELFGSDRESLEKRIQELEEQLKELERQLHELPE